MLPLDKVKTLAETHGTPIFVVNHEELAACYTKLKEGLVRTGIFYAIKANPLPSVLRTLYELGSGFDFASMGEFQLLLNTLKDLAEEEKVQFIQDKTIYANPVKPPEALEALDKYGLLCTYDNVCEIQKIKKHAPHMRLLLRICIPNTHAAVDLCAKYGCDAKEAVALWKEAVAAGLTVEGLAYHVGSQTPEMESFITGVRTAHAIAQELAKENIIVKKLDIGGGFPVKYPAVKGGMAPFGLGSNDIAFDRYKQELLPVLDALFPGVELMAEPGRAMVDTACTTVMKVLGKAVKKGRQTLYLDDGHFGSLITCFWDFKRNLRAVKQGPTTETQVWGPTCDALDNIGLYDLPELDYGDIVCADSVGSYSMVNATAYNGIPPPKIIDLPYAVPKWMRFSFPMKIAGTEYTIHELTPEVLPKAAAILGETFAKGEPQSLWLGYKPDFLADYFAKKQTDSWKTGHNFSIYITDAKNEIVAVNMNCEFDLNMEVLAGDPYMHMTILLDNAYREFYVKSKRQGRVLECFGGGVVDKAKGKGLINTFGLCAAVMGLQNGFTWAISQTSNIYSANAAERMGFTLIDEADYEKYVHEGKVAFSGLDKFFTAYVNKARPPDKQLTTAARACGNYEISMEKLLDVYLK